MKPRFTDGASSFSALHSQRLASTTKKMHVVSIQLTACFQHAGCLSKNRVAYGGTSVVHNLHFYKSIIYFRIADLSEVPATLR